MIGGSKLSDFQHTSGNGSSAGLFVRSLTIAEEHAKLANKSKHRPKRGPRGKVGKTKKR